MSTPSDEPRDASGAPSPPGAAASAPTPAGAAPRVTGWHWAAVGGLLAVTAALAVTSLVGDSITFDEPFHLAAGYAALTQGDYRLSADHPPLARLWCALPLLVMRPAWPEPDDPGWVAADVVPLARRWLFDLNANGQQLVVAGRLMMVPLLLATALATYGLGRRLGGPDAGLLALTLACFSPSLLAHGRLVTTDVPMALFATLSLLCSARLLERVTWPRVLAAGLALGGASVSKMSWPLVVPALALMFVVAAWRGYRQGRAVPRAPGKRPARDPSAPPGIGTLAAAALVMAACVCMTIWSVYRWQRPMVMPPTTTADAAAQSRYAETLEAINYQWHYALHDSNNVPRRGLVPFLCRAAVDYNLLPDGYVFGLARTLFFSGARVSYFMGEYSDTGWRAYFPVAFVIKTPIAALLLILAGVAAMWRRRLPLRDPLLLTGVAALIIVFGGYLILGNVNIGERHILPLYPLLFALGGLGVGWMTAAGPSTSTTAGESRSSTGRYVVGCLVVWLAAVNIWIHPHYLSYFNELAGGPSRGHRWLADSNIDWGQDLLRLADYARRHPDRPIKLAYFGSARPTAYLECEALPSYLAFEPTARLTPGTYVVSITQLLGVYTEGNRPSFWTPRAQETLRDFAFAAAAPLPDDATPEQRALHEQVVREYPEWQAMRLISRLRDRTPDTRIGGSLLVYHLGVPDIELLSRP